MSAKDAEKIVERLLPANPELAAMAIQRSGAEVSDQFKLDFREAWLRQMTDVERYPEALVRAAIGRALGSVSLLSGEPLDNRPGVGLTSEGLPDIDWVEIPGGTVRLEDEKSDFPVKPFRIARYPVTNKQFQAFLDAPDGFGNQRWWQEIERSQTPSPPEWSESNHPRETVSWYQAVAFYRWLSDKYRARGHLEEGEAIRLPAEWEWQQAATKGNRRNIYPWGRNWDASRANSDESAIDRTSAVGLFPNGTWLGGPLEMAGNLWEWCLNKYRNPQSQAATNIDASIRLRVIRGGSWKQGRGYLRCSTRDGDLAAHAGNDVGFRIAQDIF
jgi:formylglycine-generating enzyme required for sulfatase activity